jgi:hypothetical protein
VFTDDEIENLYEDETEHSDQVVQQDLYDVFNVEDDATAENLWDNIVKSYEDSEDR